MYNETFGFLRVKGHTIYCIYQNFAIFDFFYISQGNVATWLRCGGKNDNDFIANSLTNL